MSGSSSISNPPPAAPALSFRYVDPFLGRTLRISDNQRIQVDAPLHVIAAAAARLHLPRGYPLALEQPPPPSGGPTVNALTSSFAAVTHPSSMRFWMAGSEAGPRSSAVLPWWPGSLNSPPVARCSRAAPLPLPLSRAGSQRVSRD